MPFYTYILYSKSLKKFYTGSTQDLVNRIEEHNNGEGNFTKTGVPWELITSFEFETRSEALKYENLIKKRGAKRFLIDKGLITPDG
jgi:putative endonuclease